MGVNEEKTIYLVDGTSYLHRAYHAVAPLSTSTGFPTNAVMGFTRMLLKLLAEKSPRYLAVVFDAKGPTFRHEMFEDYKSNRPPMADDMAVQIPKVKEILEALNIKILEKEGYEADDLMGTLAKTAESKGYNVVLVTGDKDFRQLLSPRVQMWDTMRDKVTTHEDLKKEYGLDPSQFVDVMGLAGDSGDNIPGVNGVGEKTAIKLIKQFGSLEGVLEHLDKVKGKKLKENLSRCKDSAILSKELVRIDCHVPLEIDLEDLELGDPDREKLSQIFRDLEFKELWDQFAQRSKEEVDYRLCSSVSELTSMVKSIKEKQLVSFDTETTSQDPLRAKIVGLALCWEEKRAYYIPVGHVGLGASTQLGMEEVIKILRPVLEDEAIKKVGQNIKYDAEVLWTHGIQMKGIHFDTMIASYVINPGLHQHKLDLLAQQYLNYKMTTYKELTGKGKNAINFSRVPVEKAKDYSCEDADITLRLMRVLERRLKEEGNEALFYELEMPLLPVLMDMELTGIKVDIPFFKEMSKQFGQRLKELEREIFQEAGVEFNINSPQQLGWVLFEKLQLPVQKKTLKTKRYSTDLKTLKKLAACESKVPELVLKYRSLAKLKSTYLDALIKLVNPDTGRLHTSFNQTVTATGRLSSSNPNLQNIPIRTQEGREIRKGFVAEEGHVFVSADYSQIELRVFAHYSGDKSLVEAFLKGEDIHTRTAAEIMGVEPEAVTPEMRRVAKAINFGIIYGMGPQKLAEELEIDLSTAKAYITKYFERYQGVKEYREKMIQMAREKGFVTTLFNRKRHLPEINHSKHVIRAEAERMAINSPIQGTAADLIKKAMINIHQRLEREGLRSKMLLQVHDELLFESPQDEVERLVPLVKAEMEGVYSLNVPLKVDIGVGSNWEEAH